MDTNTSGEELLTKTRKPYRITKQRERWTDDEHDRFLEALKLYGRAWQQIEEHIGTKTAVQIRSHAQKFFTKLEKEAETKGIPVCQALDIEIPPPRPKRKPITPYPRKPTTNSASYSHLSSPKDAQLESESSLKKASKVDNAVQDVSKKNKDRDGNNITMHSEQQIHGHANLEATTSSVITTSRQAFPVCHSQDDHQSFLQISSTFSSLIMSTLLHNPAAHAAATFAASVWPYAYIGNSGDSSTQMSSSTPSVAAITSATVAAATAWWASHGLLPVCAPTPFTCIPLPTVVVPTPVATSENAQLQKQTTSLQDQKAPASSADDSEETGITKLKADSKTNGDKVVATSVHDSNTAQKKKLVDRSSCGSNTPSGSDVETDALEKMEKDRENVKETDANQAGIVETSNRRSKIRDDDDDNNNNQTNDSWKEVSEEGRIAFQALFTRERLPQSFSPPQVKENMNGKQSETSRPLGPDLNKIQDCCDADQESVVMRETGFKPYKRCSMEVKERQVGNTTNNQSDENVCKRLRLEGEASI